MNDNQKSKIEKMRISGMGYTAIAKSLGISKDTVKSYCRRNSLGGVMIAKTEDCVCEMCGNEVKQYPHRKKKRFCSDACRMKWWNTHPEAVNRKSISLLVCERCGKPFRSKNPAQKFCSRSCYNKMRKERGKNG